LSTEITELERIVQAAGLTKAYREFERQMRDVAKIEFSSAGEDQIEAFVRTCKQSFCAGVTEAVRKFQDE